MSPPSVRPFAPRHRAILRILAETGQVTVAELAERFEISPATARRDVVSLADLGQAVRSRGGLTSARNFRGEQHFPARVAMQTSAKAQIARKAAELLPHQGNVFVDSGTSCLAVGRLLIARPGLRVYTNSIPLIALAPEARAALISIGGEARRASLSLTGGFSQPWLTDLRFDAAVLGAGGLDLLTGAYTSEIHEAAVKSEALRRSIQRILVADAEKWNRPTAMRFAPWNAFSTFVTNQHLSADARHCLATSNVALAFAFGP